MLNGIASAAWAAQLTLNTLGGHDNVARGSVIDTSEVISSCREFADRVDKIYGLYLDATSGFKANLNQFLKGQEAVVSLVPDPVERDNLAMFIGNGDPNDPSNVILHQTTNREYRERNSPGGANYHLLSQYLIVLLFHLWEHEYRPRIAAALQLPHADQLRVPLFGDLRLLRHEILKHRAVVGKQTVGRLEVMQFSEGDTIVLEDSRVEELVRGIKSELDRIARDAGADDPLLRTIWHVR